MTTEQHDEWEQAGVIGVDSGRCWVGDPSYADSADDDCGDVGVCVPTGWGDGTYPVFVKRTDEGRVAAVTVRFIEEGND